MDDNTRPEFGGSVTEISCDESLTLALKPVSARALLAREIAPPLVLWGSAKIPIVTAEDVSLLHAREGVGKSWLALELACAIAAGVPFLGITTAPAPVLVITAELSDYWARKRLERITEQIPVSDQLHLITERELGGLDLLDPSHLDALIRLVQTLGVRLVVLDPVAELWTGEEINRDWQRLSRCLRRLRVEAGCGVLLVHHEAKGEKPGALRGQQADQNAFRGGTVLRAGVRSALRLEDHPSGRLRLAHTKSNLGPRQETLWLDMARPWAPRLAEAPKDRTAKRRENLDATRRVLEKHHGEWMAVHAIGADSDCAHIKTDTLRSYLSDLVKEGSIEHNGGRGRGSKYRVSRG